MELTPVFLFGHLALPQEPRVFDLLKDLCVSVAIFLFKIGCQLELQTRYTAQQRARGHPIQTKVSTLHFIILFVRQIIKNNKHFSHLIYVVDIKLSRK
jgi:hypothetical protein